jgi:hypothetical protein
MLSSPSQQCVCYLITRSPSAGEFRELFDCPTYSLHRENSAVFRGNTVIVASIHFVSEGPITQPPTVMLVKL